LAHLRARHTSNRSTKPNVLRGYRTVVTFQNHNIVESFEAAQRFKPARDAAHAPV
jgi:hypothetical protein